MKPINFFALLLFLCGILWVLTLSEGSVRGIQQVYYRILSPFLRGGSSMEMKARDFLAEIENSKDLENQLRAVQEEYIKLRSIEGRLRELESENNELRRALEFKTKQRLNVIAARVIKRQPSTWWETAIIDRGQSAGIGAGVPIIAPGGLAGKARCAHRAPVIGQLSRLFIVQGVRHRARGARLAFRVTCAIGVRA